MTERPILFSAPMVRALLTGTKTQTRRVAKRLMCLCGHPIEHHIEHQGWTTLGACGLFQIDGSASRCPYGVPGDRLWVREGLRCGDDGNWLYRANDAPITVSADDDERVLAMRVWAHHIERDYCPSIHMPRWASRITLEVTGVRVERLQAISKADAAAEGIQSRHLTINGFLEGIRWRDYVTDSDDLCEWFSNPVASYRTLWERINGPGSCDANPWLWVVEFKSITP